MFALAVLAFAGRTSLVPGSLRSHPAVNAAKTIPAANAATIFPLIDPP
jgi:hypothetical protein